MGLTRILEQPYQNLKIAKNVILRVNFKGEYLSAHKELEGTQTIKIKSLRVSFPMHLVSPHSNLIFETKCWDLSLNPLQKFHQDPQPNSRISSSNSGFKIQSQAILHSNLHQEFSKVEDLAQLHLTEDMTLDRNEWRPRIKVEVFHIFI
ncbi:hypothetical protein H5410_016786 [Solanum commersonii]|uniref:Uncharacterized protein n=1 Tax=Solanum commersonii TaxID=4109 RepID=A0A9J5ZYA1_SOLCO|nr:hypothetical protein H5410_016786 [Solanum commersonii]